MNETPGARVSVQARERALLELSEHLSAGRLSVTEFDERSAAIAAASSTTELAEVFADLPGITPPSAPPTSTDPALTYGVLGGLAILLALVLALVFGGWLWLVLLIVILACAPLAPAFVRRLRTIDRL
ncbi:DUF1707 SHOCT-like domain-containing protein [Nocardia paucivorans]|uniref:DUF1707 SHOCT-like domain-containing protein n=1 Tax=Nocardia paucivorans TaxID=114259 RepID=UPI000685B2AD|nr:DUF1707 domain-containing protein [Nocardia paucivorans]